MPWVGSDFSPRDVGEVVIYSYDFSRNLAAGETLVTGSFECLSVDGLDPNPANRLTGGALINGAQLSQLVSFAGAPVSSSAPRVTYRLLATVTTSLAQTLSAFAAVSVTSPEG
jgi:hypothetical protein